MGKHFGRYTWEKLHLAVLALAAGTGSIQERLRDAYFHNLALLKTHEIPWPDAEEKLADIILRLDDGEAVSDSNYNSLETELARSVSQSVVSLYDLVTRRIGDLPPRGSRLSG